MMKNKKIILDIIMTIIFIVLMDTSITGIKFHEILGLGIFALFLIHKILNWSWIKGVTKKLADKNLNIKTRIMYGIDVIMVLLTTFVIISGILISQNIFMEFAADNIEKWSNLHHLGSYTLLVVLSIHVGLHWNSILYGFKRIFSIKDTNKVRAAVYSIIYLVIAALGINSLLKPRVIENFTAPFSEKNIDIKESSKSKEYRGSKENPEFKGNREKRKSKEDENNKTSYSASTEQSNDSALDDYLSKLVCNGCGRRCPLTALSCGKGQQYKNGAIEEYNNKNSVASTDSSQSNLKKEANGYDGTKVLDAVYIMGFIIGGTHYVVKIPKKFNNSKN